MTQSRPPSPWSIKGITAEARAAAKESAAAQGVSIGAWLTNVIQKEVGGEVALPSAGQNIVPFTGPEPGPGPGPEETMPVVKDFKPLVASAEDIAALRERLAGAEAWSEANIASLTRILDDMAQRLEDLEALHYRAILAPLPGDSGRRRLRRPGIGLLKLPK